MTSIIQEENFSLWSRTTAARADNTLTFLSPFSSNIILRPLWTNFPWPRLASSVRAGLAECKALPPLLMKNDANRRGKGSSCTQPYCWPILALTERPRGPACWNHIKQTSWEERALTGTNDFTVSGNSAEDTFDLQGVIAPATGFPYSLRDVEWGGGNSLRLQNSGKKRKLQGLYISSAVV